MLDAGATDYFMVTDDDDLISTALTGFVGKHRGQNGWFVRNGYIWTPGGNLLYRHPDFSMVCGTSHIIRADLLELPATFEEASEDYIKLMLGSHIFITKYLLQQGTPLAPLPFVGAIYRTGHVGAHSRSKDVLSTYLMHAWLLKSPGELTRRLFRLRYLGRTVQSEFFGRDREMEKLGRQEHPAAPIMLDDELYETSDRST